MKTFVASTVAMLVLSISVVTQAEEIKSGLQVGDSVPAYIVNDCTGPNAGKSLCYRCKYGKRPVVNIFAREVDSKVLELISEIDKKVMHNGDKKMAAFVVHLTDDTDASEKSLKKAASDSKISKTPLTNYEGQSGPSKYKISKDADITVMMWVKHKVQVNHALKQKELSSDKIAEIVKRYCKNSELMLHFACICRCNH